MPPALALIGAAASIAGGAAAVGGTMAGFAAAGLGAQLVAGAMIGGGVMTGIGALTGNRKLQKWGGLLSLAGGIGGLATGAWTTTANSVAENMAKESFRAAELGGQAADAAGGMLGENVGGMAGDAIAQANAGAMGAANSGRVATNQTFAAGPVQVVNPAAASAQIPAGMPSSVNLGRLGGNMSTAAGPAVGGNSGMLSNSMNWMENNSRLTQAGAGLLQSGLGAYGEQEALKEQLRMREEQSNRARQRLNDSVMGVKVPVYQRKGG